MELSLWDIEEIDLKKEDSEEKDLEEKEVDVQCKQIKILEDKWWEDKRIVFNKQQVEKTFKHSNKQEIKKYKLLLKQQSN